MEDPINGPEVKPRLIFHPLAIYLHDSTYNQASNTGDLLVSWTPSISDTQLNFRGYFLRVYLTDSIKVDNINIEAVGAPVKDVLLDRSVNQDTFYLFKDLPLNRYHIAVWGVRQPSSTAPDSLILTKDSVGSFFSFDPRPLEDPANLMASAYDKNSVRLHWDLPVTDTQSNLVGYRIFYYQNQKSAPVFGSSFMIPAGKRDTTLYLTAYNTTGGPSKEDYIFSIRSVRNDSTVRYDRKDSVIWYPAERIPADTLHKFDASKGLFIGNSGGRFDLIETDLDKANLSFEVSGGSLTLKTLQGTLLSTQTRKVADLEHDYYKTPLPESAYNTTTLTLDKIEDQSGGYIVYIKIPFDNGKQAWHCRLFFQRAENGTLVDAQNRIKIRGTLQSESSKLYF